MTPQIPLERSAPNGSATEYDRAHLALYAALLDADAAGVDWAEAAATLMQLDPKRQDTERCWRSHLDRARWITGSGLAEAVETFGRADT